MLPDVAAMSFANLAARRDTTFHAAEEGKQLGKTRACASGSVPTQSRKHHATLARIHIIRGMERRGGRCLRSKRRRSAHFVYTAIVTLRLSTLPGPGPLPMMKTIAPNRAAFFMKWIISPWCRSPSKCQKS